ncbi:Origin recognition complex, subunit 1 [Tilletia horrida]|uniref:Origin recognition complex subunit 1 n=1 Tax=Tilletia horrida TaxID=155126 RepID=A0AAN6GEJ5_9BASI|nr:Origin recognition complex, subunit 1 [Tilletia horrida]KAK0536403.1 Origin recognition complex, subunit 1 [Tilletia horrida]
MTTSIAQNRSRRSTSTSTRQITVLRAARSVQSSNPRTLAAAAAASSPRAAAGMMRSPPASRSPSLSPPPPSRAAGSRSPPLSEDSSLSEDEDEDDTESEVGSIYEGDQGADSDIVCEEIDDGEDMRSPYSKAKSRMPLTPPDSCKRKRGPGSKTPRTPSKRVRLNKPLTPSSSVARTIGAKVTKHVRVRNMATQDTSFSSPTHRDAENKDTLPQLYRLTPHERAKRVLHVGATPDVLPCRDEEFNHILDTVTDALRDRAGACTYVAGCPGTGKTATVRSVVRRLHRYVDDGRLERFKFVEINGMKLGDPSEVYVRLWEALRPESDTKRVSPKFALAALNSYFSSKKPGTGPPSPGRWRTGSLHSSSARHGTVVLMDELDQLVCARQEVLYNLFEWANSEYSRLIVVAVANTSDLPERQLTAKVRSRLGMTRVNFEAYRAAQLQEIVKVRLGMDNADSKASEAQPKTNPKKKATAHERSVEQIEAARKKGCSTIFKPAAIEFAAKRVAGVTGDARRMLDVCRRAIEAAEAQAEAAIEKERGSTAKTGARQHGGSGAVPPSSDDQGEAGGPEPSAHAKAISTRCQQITPQLVADVFASMVTSAKSKHIASLSLHAKLLLVALLRLIRRTGLAEVRVGDLLIEQSSIAGLHYIEKGAPGKGEQGSGWQDWDLMANLSDLELPLAALCQAGLITAVGSGAGAGRAGINGRVMLNVFEDEVRLALELSKDTKLKNIL